MYKKVVSEYVSDELNKGKTIDSIRAKLVTCGYQQDDIDEVLRSFEHREAHLKNVETKIKRHTAITAGFILLVIVINAFFFIHYLTDPNYVLVKETPNGLVTQSITQEELDSLQKQFNQTIEENKNKG